MLDLILAATATALATGLGTLPVFYLGPRAARWQAGLYGSAAGAMGVASVIGLIKPGLDAGSVGAVAIGVAVGVIFLLATRLELRHAEGGLAGRRDPGARLSLLVFIVLFVHSFPEGFSIGTAYASDISGLSLFVILAIGLQNIPEGTSVAIPMSEAGYSRRRQLWTAIATSLPQPLGAVAAYLAVETVSDLLPFSFGFAAGAMLSLIVAELGPRALIADHRLQGAVGILIGGGIMLALGAALGV